MQLKIMTFNLRYADARATPPDAWAHRRPLMQECVRFTAPDLIGTQEGLYSQIKDFAADQPDYDWIGLGREGGSKGEFMAVFYRPARLEPLEFDHFWLSDTPEVVGSRTWGNWNHRMVTWVRFRDRQNGAEFYFWNTHFDHRSQPAREKAAALVAQRINALPLKLPVVLVGDFNAVSRANPSYDILIQEGGFRDAWFEAKEHIGPNYDSFHGYGAPVPDGRHIDWILSRGEVSTQSIELVTFQQDGQYPSDHFPIMASMLIGKSSL